MIKIRSSFLVVIVSSALLAVGCSTLTNEGRFDTGKENFLAGNFDQSFKQLMPIAKQGNPEAQYAVGYMYFYGLGTKQNMREAANWMQKAADSGQPQAQLALKQLQQDQIVTTGAFSGSDQSPGYRGHSSGGAGASRAADVPEQLTATWPQPSTLAPVAEPVVSPQAQEYNPGGDLHSSGDLLLNMAGSEQQQWQQADFSASDDTVGTDVVADQSGHYAVQLMGAYTQDRLENFVRKLSISPDQFRIMHTERDSRDWFVLVYGDYPDMATALEAKRDLPRQLQVLKPWVRSLAQLKQGVA